MATPAEQGSLRKQVDTVYVYEAPLRLWHWVNAVSIVVLMVTGYFIGSPPPSVPGEASDSYLLGYIRFTHFAAAYVFGVGFLGRLYWAVVGNRHARQLLVLPVWDRTFWREVLHEIRWYSFLEKRPRAYEGHNPLAQCMFFVFGLVIMFMVVTGGALYSEGKGVGGWQDALFGWVIPLFGGSQAVHSWHHLGMWSLVCFLIIHIYAAVRDDIMSRQSVISSMVSGWRMFERD